MAFTPDELDRLEAVNPQAAAMIRQQMGTPNPIAGMTLDPSRMGQVGATGPIPGIPAPTAPPPAPAAPPQLGTGAGADFAQQLMSNVRAQYGASEQIRAAPRTLAQPRPAEAAAPQPQRTEQAARPAGGGGGSAVPKMQRDFEQSTLGNLDEQQRNIENQRDYDITQQQMQAAELDRQAKEVEAADAERRADHELRSQHAQSALDALDSQSRQLGEYKEDPNRVFANQSTGDRILGAAALLLSGFASGASGGKNMALEAVNRAQDRDIEAQRAAYQSKKDSLAAQRSTYGLLMDRYKDEDQADAALRVLQLDQMQRKLQIMAAGSQSEAVRLKADQALTALKQQRAQAAYQFQVQAYQAAHPAGAAGSLPKALQDVYGKGGEAQARADMAEFARAHPEIPPGNLYQAFVSQTVQSGQGKLGAKPNNGRAGGIFGQEANAEAVEENAATLRKLHSEYGLLDALSPFPAAAQKRAEIEKRQNMIIPAAARMVHGASASKEEIDLERKGLSGAWDPMGTQDARLRVIEEEARRRKAKMALGLQQGFGSATEGDEGEK